MKMCIRKALVIFVLCAFMLSPISLAAGAFAAAAPTLLDQGIDLTGGSVHFPKLQDFADEALAATIQQTLHATGRIQAYLTTLPLLNQAESKMHVSWRGGILGDMLSVQYSASGDESMNTPPHRWMSVTIDLADGHTVQLTELFQDMTAAAQFLTEYLEDTVAPALSAHLQNSQLTPLPEQFHVSEAGITFLYPFNQLSTLSDRAGAVTVDWGILLPYLNLDTESILSRSDIASCVALNADSKESLTQICNAGQFPGIPLKIEESVQPLVAQYRLLADPDLYEGGRMVLLDDALFRDVWLLTDKLTDTYDQSVIQGIRMDRGCVCGLSIGQTTLDQWRTALGTPDTTFAVDERSAELNRLLPGTSDYYSLGKTQLRLHADEAGVLRSIILQ